MKGPRIEVLSFDQNLTILCLFYPISFILIILFIHPNLMKNKMVFNFQQLTQMVILALENPSVLSTVPVQVRPRASEITEKFGIRAEDVSGVF